MLVIAHRGASRDRPENTLPAFALAIEQGADMIETDLHRTRDGEVAIVHDRNVAGVDVPSSTLAELRAAAPDLPVLDEVLDAFGAAIPFNLEFKQGADGPYPGLVERVVQSVRKHDLLERTLFSSFYDPVLSELRELEPEARIALLVSRRAPIEIVARARRVRAEAVNPELALTTRELVDEIHAAGLAVHVFTVDDESDQLRLRGWGVDGIFTNVPALLLERLGR